MDERRQLVDRRKFLKSSLAAGAAYAALAGEVVNAADQAKKKDKKAPKKHVEGLPPYDGPKVRLGFIGVGLRGTNHLRNALHRNDISVVALADPDEKVAIPRAKKLIARSHQPEPKIFSKGPEDYKNLLEMKNLDAVIIATPWEWHCRQAVDAMKAGITPGVEVGGALNMQECWDYVDTSEKTGVQLFCLENVCYRRDVMAIFNMVRQDVFGELLYGHAGYQHDLRKVKFNDGIHPYDHGVKFGPTAYSEAKWRTIHSVKRNGELYPTHGLGPVATMMNINRGNRLKAMSSVATKSRGLHRYIVQSPYGGPDCPNAKVQFKEGDIVSTQIQTENGETICLTHDTESPRPYSIGFRVQGTNGLWMQDGNLMYIEKISPDDQWEPDAKWLEKYDHPLWKRFGDLATGAGHGGMDFFVMNAFIESIKRKAPYPLDVYDLATWYAITPLSEKSIAEGGTLQQIPDYTRGKWKTRKPIFAPDDQY